MTPMGTDEAVVVARSRSNFWKLCIVLAGVVGFFAAILMPVQYGVNRATRHQCSTFLRSIGQAMLLYANETRGVTPDSLATLMLAEDMVPEIYVCPSDAVASKAANAASFDEHSPKDCSYVYVGDRLPMTYATVPANTLVLFDRDDNHDRDGVNALFADGHVEFLVFQPTGKLPAWWLDVQDQITRGVRPVMLPPAATQPAR